MSRELILCALHRLGKPSMAADVADQAAALALSEPGWPRNTGAKISPASAAAHLNQIAEKAGAARDTSGNNRPLFQPKGGTFDPNYPMPEPPRPPRAEQPLSQSQAMTTLLALMDVVELQKARIGELEQERLDAHRRSLESQGRYERAIGSMVAAVRDRLARVGIMPEES